jgi:RNA polymerase sigma factor (sigma-70 family)
MDQDTEIGGPNGRFPDTRLSVIRGAGSEVASERGIAWERMVSSYWKPVYRYIRLQWRLSNEDAKDLTQAFFMRAMEKDFFVRYDPTKARLSTFMRVCVDRFAANDAQASQRQKRGGGTLPEPLSGAEPDEYLHREWIRTQFADAVQDLRAKLDATKFAVFEAYDLADDRPSYRELADRFGVKETDVTNYLSAARRELRRALLERGYGVHF